MQSSDGLDRVLNFWRSVDEKIDLSKSEVQWKIVLAMMSKSQCTTAELAKEIRENKKATIDAVRKLIKKGLVVKVKFDVYALSEAGKQLTEEIRKFGSSVLPTLTVEDTEEYLNNPTHFYYFSEILKASIVNGGEVPVSRLALELGVSRNTVRTYLELFSTKYKFFKKVTKRTLTGKVRQTYVVSDAGLKYGNRIPGMFKTKNNLLMKFMLRITASTRFETSVLKLMAFFTATAPLLIFFRGDALVHKVEAIAWLYSMIFFSLLSVSAYFISRT
ncbi:MarR family transcriptional regulator [Sulfodiicoccus acidiphilus]|uniref:MarR family transcriptional regulator n=1 Tax=Sulfodiicoccus acidiphilus TaxID=1670455 RepID=A0A348B4X0_9CREN|nr:MarR family transcriptional regulator [Sulfodiicoccus acidiphilus]BBD73222.1 MarR family transcriptional regulator [Sulfodiicoccus acidiphilus]